MKRGNEAPKREQTVRSSTKQSVNISDETMRRMARVKLSRALTQKLAYNQTGAFTISQTPGQILSVKA